MESIDNLYKMIDGNLCATTEELCDKLDISRKTLSEWESKGCPKASRGWWPIWEVLKWRGAIGNGVKTEEDLENMSMQQKKLMYETEWKKQQAEKVEFLNSVARGEYISKEDASAELQRFFTILKRSMLGYSRKVASELGSYVDAVTARRIEKMITELSIDALGQLSIDGVYKATKKKEKA